MTKEKSVLVVGSSGTLGGIICNALFDIFQSDIKLIVTDYNRERGIDYSKSFNRNVEYRYIDINNIDSIEKALSRVDFCLIALKQKHPHIQKICIDKAVDSVDVSISNNFINELRLLNELSIKQKCKTVCMAGFFPGLSGVIANDIITSVRSVDEVNIAYLANMNAQMGASGLSELLSVLTRNVKDKKNIIRKGFSVSREMSFLHPFHNQKVFSVDWSGEQHLFSEFHPSTKFCYWIGANKGLLIFLLKIVQFILNLGFYNSVAKRKKLATFLCKYVKHNPNIPETSELSFEIKADDATNIKKKVLKVDSDYKTTAIFACLVLKQLAISEKNGVLFPFQILNYSNIEYELKKYGVYLTSL